jgi:hypothetical protein
MPSSPSWRTIKNRSASLPRVRRGSSPGSNSPSPDRNRRIDDESTIRSWWLGNKSPPRMNSEVYVRGSRRSPSPPQRSRPSKSTPVLTLALLKLDELMLEFTKRLSDPSMSNVEVAVALLDGSVATASPNTTPSKGSPVSGGLSGASPSRSPIRDWFTNNSTNSDSPTKTAHSALALESEFEKFALPLFLFAGAEAVYGKCGHVQVDVATQLASLYQQTANELENVRAILCDPFLLGMEHLAPTMIMYKDHASSLTVALESLVELCRIRSQMIPIQFTLWESSQPTFEDIKAAFLDLLPSIPKDAGRAGPMKESIEKEIKLWTSMMNLGTAVERCR